MIKDEWTKFSGNERLVWYDFYMEHLALSYYLEYGKAGYNQ